PVVERAQGRTRPRADRVHRIRRAVRRTTARRRRLARTPGAPFVSTLRIRRPDDWHLHLRDGAHLAAVLPHTAARFARALVMPNLKPPMTTTAALAGYRARILQALPEGMRFEPMMTLY